MRAKKPAARHFYRQGKTKVYLKPVDNTLAVRYNKSAKAQVRKTLRSLGQVSEIESQQLFILYLPAGTEETARQDLQTLIDKGAIESVAPVLRAEESQLFQVLTDEITVRFKPTVAAKERRQMEKKYGLTLARKNEFVPNQFVVKEPRSKGLDTLNVANCVPRNPDVESVIEDVVKTGRRGKGCLVFCATGNEYSQRIGFPSNHPLALAVGASNDRGKRSKYSNRGKGIQFVAPSDDPDRDRQGISTTEVSIKNRGYSRGLYTKSFSGTSSATPLAAGIGALVLSVNPSLTWKQVRSILRSTADKIDLGGGTYTNGYSIHYGFGRLNAFEAVNRAAGGGKSGNKSKASKRGKSAGRKTTKKKR